MNRIKTLIPRKLILQRRKILPIWWKVSHRNTKVKTHIPILHLHVTDHCNLNCRGCDNFSPLAPVTFAKIDIFERDCAKIAKIAQSKIHEIQLLGGEPLLHPQIVSFLKISRKYFPENEINIITNGILLIKQTEQFWQTCREENIHIIVTKYPIKLDFDRIKELAQKEKVNFSFYGNTESIEKTMECIPIDLNGKQNPTDSFLRCSRANRCIALDNGKIYTCSFIPYIKYFNYHFNTNFRPTPKDYLELDSVNSLDELLNFVSRPVPFCRYCNIKATIWDIGYGASKKDITEWIGNTPH